MAVYTDVPTETLECFLADYAVGTLVSAKGIAEGVSNSNFLVDTSNGRYILTLYERRIDVRELPWFLQLMEHLADAGQPVPRPIHDRNGHALRQLAGKSAALIQFLPGVSVSQPTAAQAGAAGAALARLHLAGGSFIPKRRNGLGPSHWQESAADLGPRFDSLQPGLWQQVQEALARIETGWPTNLPRGVIHADLFPDNVLMLGERVTGLIDFYFACTDFLAYDLAVLHAAWCFPPDGRAPLAGHARALFAGYQSVRPLGADETRALPLLAEGAALRFLLSRAQDWLEPPSDALVRHKDPLPFARRLAHYAAHGL